MLPSYFCKMQCDEALNASQRGCGHATKSPFPSGSTKMGSFISIDNQLYFLGKNGI